jgi:tetratricopeptide (TPR) repeat protein
MDGEIVAELGMAYNMSDEGKMAQKICVAYWFKDHDNIAVNRVLADAYFLDREFDMAKYSYEELLAAGDTTYMVLFNLGVCYERQDSLVNQGAVLNAMRQYAEAQGCFEQALTLLLPDSVKMFTCFRGIAEGLYAKADYGAAAEAFGQALAYQPLSLTTYYYYALCLDATGKHNVAMTNYKEFLRLAVREENPTNDLRQMIVDARKRMK